LTEIDDSTATVLTNGHAESFASQGSSHTAPLNSTLGEGGNAAAETNWDPTNDLSASQEWVEVPSEAAKPEAATPVASNVKSWADEQPDSPVVEVRNSFIFTAKLAAAQACHYFSVAAGLIVMILRQLFIENLIWTSTDRELLQAIPVTAATNDGFSEVRNKGANNRGDGHRGRNDRGGRGGRGRGDGRGRGRGNGASRGNDARGGRGMLFICSQHGYEDLPPS